MARAAIAILSTENLIHNILTIKSYAPKKKIIAMVKANAYGHGIRSVAKRIEQHIYSLGVASIDEAQALRAAGIKIPITLMEGVFEADELLIASCQKFHVIFHNHLQIEWLESLDLPVKIKAWIKIDTGMGRIGFNINEAEEIYDRISNNNNIINPVCIMSHMACSEDINHELNNVQIQKFEIFSSKYKTEKSLANSGAIINFPNAHYDVIRPGLAIYGASPISNISAKELGLKPVMSLQTRLIAIKAYSAGSSIGYGASYICKRNMLVGVIAMGYGDGYPRDLAVNAPILVNKIKCEIIGKVSMDMMTIDLTNCSNAKIGDMAILWGEGLPIEEVARFSNRSVYELLCAIQYRIKFHWTIL